MPLTSLDPTSALVLIDLQKGVVSLPTAHPAAPVITNSRTLADAFRARNLPVVLVNVIGGASGRVERPPRTANRSPDWSDLVPGLARQPSDLTITKKTWGAFTNTNLDAHLKRLGVTQIVLAGVSTSIGVESTARFAFELGYNVTLAIDAMTDLNADAHANSVTRIFPRLGGTDTTREVLDLLARTRG